MAAEITVPVKLEVLQGSISEIKNILSNLKPNSSSWKELSNILRNMEKGANNLQIAFSKPFGSQSLFNSAEKLINNIEDALSRARIILLRVNFSDLNLNPNQLNTLNEFKTQLAAIEAQARSFKATIKQELQDSSDWNNILKLDPNAVTHSYDEIVTAVLQRTRLLENEKKKAEDALTLASTATQRYEKTLSFFQSRDLKTGMGEDFSKFFILQANGITRFKSGQQSPFYDWIQTNLRISPSQLEELKTYNANQINTWILNFDLSKIIDSANRNMAKKNIAADSLKGIIDLLSIALQVLQALSAANGKIALNESNLRPLIEALTASENLFRTSIENAARALLSLLSAFGATSTACSQLKYALLQTNAEYMKMARTTNMILGVRNTVLNFMGFTLVLNLTKKAVKEAANHIKELDTVMNKIAIVTDMDTSDLWGLIDQYSKMALSYGTTIKGAYEVSLIYYQLGLGTSDVLTLTNETLKLAKISGLDYATTTDYMTTAIRGFKMEMQDAATVVDVYSALAANTAVSLEELAVAMSKTASSMESVGSTFEETSAMIGTMVAVTRESATNIGSAMKSIASRYGELTKDPTILKDAEGEAISFNKVDTALLSVGISMKTVDGLFRNFTDVIIELGEKWDLLDSTLQRYIATLFAGNRQQSRFLALVGNVDLLKSNLNVAENSEDTGTVQALKSLDSLESKINLVLVAYQQFYTNIGAESAWKGALDIIKNYINMLNNLPKLFGKIPVGAVSMIADAITLIKNMGSLIIEWIGSLYEKILLKHEASTITDSLVTAIGEAIVRSELVAREGGAAIGTAMKEGVEAAGLSTVNSSQAKPNEAGKAAEPSKTGETVEVPVKAVLLPDSIQDAKGQMQAEFEAAPVLAPVNPYEAEITAILLLISLIHQRNEANAAGNAELVKALTELFNQLRDAYNQTYKDGAIKESIADTATIDTLNQLIQKYRDLADAARDAGLSIKDGAPVQPSKPEPQQPKTEPLLPVSQPVTGNVATPPVLAPAVDAGQIQAQVAALLQLLAAYASLSSALSSTSGLSFLREEEIEKAKTTIEEITQSPLFTGTNMALGNWETVTTNLERLRELAKELGIDLLETGAQGAQAGATAAEGQLLHEGVVQRLTEKYELLKEKMLNLPLSSSLFNNSKLSSFASGLRMLTGLFDLTSLGGKAAAGSIMLIGGALQIISNIGKTNPFIAIASGIMAIVNGISTLYESPAERLERLETTATELSNKAKELKVDTKDLEQSKNKIESLEKARYESAEAAEEYLEAADELADKFPILISGFDDAGNAIIDVTRMEDELANARRETAEATLKAAKAERDAKVEKLKLTGNDIVKMVPNFTSEPDSATTQEDLAIVSQVREWNADLLHRALLSLISGNAYANSSMVAGLLTTYDSQQVLAGADEFLNAIMMNASEQLYNHLAQYLQENGSFNVEEVYSSFFNKFGELIETNGKIETYGITEDQFFNFLSFLEAFRAPTEQSTKDNLTIASKLSGNIDFTEFRQANKDTINFEDDVAVLSGIYEKFSDAFTNWDIENIQKYYALYETAIATLDHDGQFYLRNKGAIEELQEKLGPLMATFRQTYGEYNSANKQIISSVITGLKYNSAQYDAINDLNFLSESNGLTAILTTDLENLFKEAQEKDPNLLMEDWLKTDEAMGDIDVVNDFWKNWAGKYINGEVAHEVIDGMLKDTTHYSAQDIIAKLGLEEDDPFTGYLINAYQSRAEQINTSINNMLDKYGKNSKGVQLLKAGVVGEVHDKASDYGIEKFDFTYIDQSFLDLASTEILALESLGLYETALNYSQGLIRLYQYLQYETEEVRNAVLDAFVKNGGNTTTGVSAMVTAAKNAGMEDTSKIEALGEYINLSFSLLALAVANEFIEKWGKEGQKLYSNLRSGLDVSLVDEILDLAKNMDFDLSQEDLLADGQKFVLSAEKTVEYLNAYKDYLHGSAALTVEFENALRTWNGESPTASTVEDVLTKEFWADTLEQDLGKVTGLVQEKWITLFNQLGINIADYANKLEDGTYQWKQNINTDAIIDLFNATYDSVAYASWLMESAIMQQLKAAQWDTGDYSSLASILNDAFKGRTNDEIKTELYKLAAGIGDLSILDTFPDVKSAVDHISKAELDAASRLTANFDNLKSAFDQLSSIGIGSVVTGRLRYELELLSMVDDNGVVNSTFDLVEAYQAIYEKMNELNTATIAELNSAYATLLSAEDLTNIDITNALKNASGMSYNDFGQLLSRYNIKLESLLQNELTAYMAGIERTGFGLIRIKNWESFAKTVFNTNDLDALRNNPEYISAFKAYNDGLIELNKNAEDAIVEEVASLKNMKRGSLINLTNFYVRLLQAALKAIDEADFSSLLNTNVSNLGERLIVSGTEMMLHFPKDNFIPKDYATIYGSTSAMREKFSSAPNIAAVFALIDEAGNVVDDIDEYVNSLYSEALAITKVQGLDQDPESVILAILELDRSKRNLAIDIREYADNLNLDEVFEQEDAVAIGAHLKEEMTSLLRALTYVLEGYGATLEDGILTLSDDANLFGVAATIRDMVDIAGIEIADNLAEIEDAINEVLKSYSDAIKKGIQGGMTNVEALNLTSYAKDLGLDNELLFTQTTEGLKLSNRSARELYSAIKDIDAIQGQIVFDELKQSLIESEDHFKSIASTTAYIKQLREGTAYPNNSKRIADLEEELALAERIQAERATSEDSSYNFMDNDIPAGLQNMLNYWSNWSDAFEAIKNSTKGGKAKNTIGYLDFYNIVTEMGNLADLTGQAVTWGQKTVDNSLKAADLITLAAGALKNVDGEMVVDLSKIKMNINTAGVKQMSEDVDKALDVFAQELIDMLDSMISLLEVIVAMEQLGDIDTNFDGEIDLSELFDDWEILGPDSKLFSQEAQTSAQAILDQANALGPDSDLYKALDAVKINGYSMREMLEDVASGIRDLPISAEAYQSVLNAFYQAAMSNDWDEDNVGESLRKILSSAGLDSYSIDVGKAKTFYVTGSSQYVLNWEGANMDDAMAALEKAGITEKDQRKAIFLAIDKLNSGEIEVGTEQYVSLDYAVHLATGSITLGDEKIKDGKHKGEYKGTFGNSTFYNEQRDELERIVRDALKFEELGMNVSISEDCNITATYSQGTATIKYNNKNGKFEGYDKPYDSLQEAIQSYIKAGFANEEDAGSYEIDGETYLVTYNEALGISYTFTPELKIVYNGNTFEDLGSLLKYLATTDLIKDKSLWTTTDKDIVDNKTVFEVKESGVAKVTIDYTDDNVNIDYTFGGQTVNSVDDFKQLLALQTLAKESLGGKLDTATNTAEFTYAGNNVTCSFEYGENGVTFKYSCPSLGIETDSLEALKSAIAVKQKTELTGDASKSGEIAMDGATFTYTIDAEGKVKVELKDGGKLSPEDAEKTRLTLELNMQKLLTGEATIDLDLKATIVSAINEAVQSLNSLSADNLTSVGTSLLTIASALSAISQIDATNLSTILSSLNGLTSEEGETVHPLELEVTAKIKDYILGDIDPNTLVSSLVAKVVTFTATADPDQLTSALKAVIASYDPGTNDPNSLVSALTAIVTSYSSDPAEPNKLVSALTAYISEYKDGENVEKPTLDDLVLFISDIDTSGADAALEAWRALLEANGVTILVSTFTDGEGANFNKSDIVSRMQLAVEELNSLSGFEEGLDFSSVYNQDLVISNVLSSLGPQTAAATSAITDYMQSLFTNWNSEGDFSSYLSNEETILLNAEAEITEVNNPEEPVEVPGVLELEEDQLTEDKVEPQKVKVIREYEDEEEDIPTEESEKEIPVKVNPEINTDEFLEELREGGEQGGQSLNQGTAEGIGENVDEATEASKNAGTQIVDAGKEGLGSHSPSIYMILAGKDLILGLVQGITENQEQAITTSTQLGTAVIEAISTALSEGLNTLAEGINEAVESVDKSYTELEAKTEQVSGSIRSHWDALVNLITAAVSLIQSLVLSLLEKISITWTIGSKDGKSDLSGFGSGTGIDPNREMTALTEYMDKMLSTMEHNKEKDTFKVTMPALTIDTSKTLINIDDIGKKVLEEATKKPVEEVKVSVGTIIADLAKVNVDVASINEKVKTEVTANPIPNLDTSVGSISPDLTSTTVDTAGINTKVQTEVTNNSIPNLNVSIDSITPDLTGTTVDTAGINAKVLAEVTKNPISNLNVAVSAITPDVSEATPADVDALTEPLIIKSAKAKIKKLADPLDLTEIHDLGVLTLNENASMVLTDVKAVPTSLSLSLDSASQVSIDESTPVVLSKPIKVPAEVDTEDAKNDIDTLKTKIGEIKLESKPKILVDINPAIIVLNALHKAIDEVKLKKAPQITIDTTVAKTNLNEIIEILDTIIEKALSLIIAIGTAEETNKTSKLIETIMNNLITIEGKKTLTITISGGNWDKLISDLQKIAEALAKILGASGINLDLNGGPKETPEGGETPKEGEIPLENLPTTTTTEVSLLTKVTTPSGTEIEMNAKVTATEVDGSLAPPIEMPAEANSVTAGGNIAPVSVPTEAASVDVPSDTTVAVQASIEVGEAGLNLLLTATYTATIGGDIPADLTGLKAEYKVVVQGAIPGPVGPFTVEYKVKGGGCFVAGTKISMADGTIKNIEDILVGDLVISYNTNANEFVTGIINKAYVHHNTPELIKVSLSDGTSIILTPGHPLLSTSGWKSRDIENSLYEHNTIATWLNIGDILIKQDYNASVISIENINVPEHYDTYNAEVEEYHTFIANGIVAHNMKVPFATGNVGLASGTLGHVTGPAHAKSTLMGELGPELVVSNGRYFVAGQNGAEMVDLDKDAIVFNHLQTEQLLKNGMSKERGRAVTNERNAVAFAKGNIGGGPAMASASAALAALKQIRAMWDSFLKASAKDLAGAGGSGGGGGGGGDKGGKGSDAGRKSFIEDVERWYNLMQEIAKLEKVINHEETLRAKLEGDLHKNGTAYYKSLKESLSAIQKEIKAQEELNISRREYFNLRREQLNEDNGPFNQLYEFDPQGQLKYKDNTTIKGSKATNGYAFLADLMAQDPNTGKPKYTVELQYKILKKAGFAKYMKFDSSGNEIKLGGTDSDEGPSEDDYNTYYSSMVLAFWDRVEALKTEMQTLYDSVAEGENNLLELELQRNELLEAMYDNQKELENSVLSAIEDMRQREIDALLDERDKLEEATGRYIDGLSEALDKERLMYDTQENQNELDTKKRRLGILLRSGASAEDIYSLQKEITESEKNMYFDAQLAQIDAIQLASDLEIERLDTQILIMQDTLDFLKEMGLLWYLVYEVMGKSSAEITQFVMGNDSLFWANSPLELAQTYEKTLFLAKQWTAFAADQHNMSEILTWNLQAQTAEALNTYSDTMSKLHNKDDFWKNNKERYEGKFTEVFEKTGDRTKAATEASKLFETDKSWYDREKAAGKKFIGTEEKEYEAIDDTYHWVLTYKKEVYGGLNTKYQNKGEQLYFESKKKEEHKWKDGECKYCHRKKPKKKESSGGGGSRNCNDNCAGVCKGNLTGGTSCSKNCENECRGGCKTGCLTSCTGGCKLSCTAGCRSQNRINNSSAKGNFAFAKGKRTLIGELGPELIVSNGQYQIAGRSGAEFVNLPDDAIVFNHMQTRSLLRNGRAGRGKSVVNDARSIALSSYANKVRELRNSTPFSQLFEYDSLGLLKYKSNTKIQGSNLTDAYAFLADLMSMDAKGNAKYSAKLQYEILKKAGFEKYMLYDSSGNKIKLGGTGSKNDLNTYYHSMVLAFWDKVESDKSSMQALYASIAESERAAQKLELERDKILKEMQSSGSIIIENASVNMTVQKIANDYDAKRAGEQALNEMLRIANKTSAANNIRR